MGLFERPLQLVELVGGEGGAVATVLLAVAVAAAAVAAAAAAFAVAIGVLMNKFIQLN